jgi:hypothetical protein
MAKKVGATLDLHTKWILVCVQWCLDQGILAL